MLYDEQWQMRSMILWLKLKLNLMLEVVAQLVKELSDSRATVTKQKQKLLYSSTNTSHDIQGITCISHSAGSSFIP